MAIAEVKKSKASQASQEGGSAAALPVSGVAGGASGGREVGKGDEIIEGKRMQARGNPFALSPSQNLTCDARVFVAPTPPLSQLMSQLRGKGRSEGGAVAPTLERHRGPEAS